MSGGSGKGKDGQTETVLLQRPLSTYRRQQAESDEEFARKIQEEEETRSQQFQEDEALAQQLARELNGEIGGSGGPSDVSNDTDVDGDPQGEFTRYRGMTGVDRMVAEQMQRQENNNLMQQRRILQMAVAGHRMEEPDPGGNHDNRGSNPVQPGQHLRPNVVMVDRRSHGNRVFQLGGIRGPRRFVQGPLRQPGAANLPDGEDDPDLMLLTMGGGMENNFLNIMRDPLLLVMALSRAPQFNAMEGNVDLNDYEALWELGERLGEVQRRGMTEAQLQNLPTHEYQEGASATQSSDCQVCLAAFKAGETVRTLPCLHDYHSKCIDEWLKRNATCPICRQEVKPSN